MLAINGRLSLETAYRVLSDPVTCASLIGLQILILLVGVYRWRLILAALGHQHSYGSLLAWNWIGQFFGTVAPSAVATDATRFAYLRRDGCPAGVAAKSLVVDRLCGVAGSLLVAVVLGVRMIPVVFDAPMRSALIWAALSLLGAGLLLWRLRHHRFAQAAADRVWSGFSAARSMKWVAATSVAITAVALILKVVTIWLIGHALVPDAQRLSRIFEVAPIGFLAESLPFTPGGFGTAHLAFEYLFAAAGIAGGAGYFNVYFIVRLLTSLFGGVLWLALDGGRPRNNVMMQRQAEGTGGGCSDVSRRVRGSFRTRMAVFFRDLGHGKIKVSFRSTGAVDVNAFAR